MGYSKWRAHRSSVRGIMLSSKELVEYSSATTPEIVEKMKEKEMKFDVVIGNPPYQDANGKSAAKGQLWPYFVEKSINLCKDEGYVALIHPSPWRKPEHKTWNILTSNEIEYLEIHSKKDGQKTFGASTRYDWYIVKKSDEPNKTQIKDENGETYTLDLKTVPFLPNSNIDLFNKMIAKKDEGLCEVMFSRSAYGTDKAWVSKNEDTTFKYPCVALMTKGTPIKLVYSNTNANGHFGVSKVIISKTGTLCCLNDCDGKFGMTEWMFGIKTYSKEEGDRIIKVLKSIEFEKIWSASQWLSMTREWKIFKHFRKNFWEDFE